jgi:hypothetical protein
VYGCVERRLGRLAHLVEPTLTNGRRQAGLRAERRADWPASGQRIANELVELGLGHDIRSPFDCVLPPAAYQSLLETHAKLPNTCRHSDRQFRRRLA